MNENVLEEPGAGQHLRCDSFRTHFEAVARGLFDLGYTSSTVRTFRWCLADFDRWAVLRGVAVGATSTMRSSRLFSPNGSARADSTGAIGRQSAAFSTTCASSAS